MNNMGVLALGQSARLKDAATGLAEVSGLGDHPPEIAELQAQALGSAKVGREEKS